MNIGGLKVPGFEIKTAVRLRLPSKDASGDSSSTARTEQGVKGKQVTVSLKLNFEDKEQLTALTQLAEQVDNSGKRTVHAINDMTANSMQIRQVKFSDTLSVRPINKLKAWLISFTLVEHISVSELNEKKQSSDVAVAQSSEGETIDNQEPGEEQLELTFTEKILKNVDDLLKPDETA